jgi:methylenetetrahydrofolate dehydrogenase (NADP+)/methenyltetrahydrofolate cyclohydrolase
MGKGETAGSPIIEHLRKLGIYPFTIDSHTRDRDNVLQEAEIIISAVGKKVITEEKVQTGCILIGVGIHSIGGKLCGDYDENEVENKAAFYTPTPGGVGPINVAFLLDNLVQAAESSQ